MKKIRLLTKKDLLFEDATFEDIEWNYGNNISESLSYDLAKARIEELEEENKKLKEENKHIFANVNDDELLRSNAMNWAEANELRQRIDEAIEYLEHEQFKRTILGFGRNRYLDAIKNETIKILKGE